MGIDKSWSWVWNDVLERLGMREEEKGVSEKCPGLPLAPLDFPYPNQQKRAVRTNHMDSPQVMQDAYYTYTTTYTTTQTYATTTHPAEPKEGREKSSNTQIILRQQRGRLPRKAE